MPPGLHLMMNQALVPEILFSFIIIVASLMIYFSTREMYKLSSYEGLKYFRQAFLLFAVAFFFRSSIRFFMLTFNTRTILDLSPGVLSQITFFIFIYASSLAVLYLLYSVMWKKWKNHNGIIYILNAIAIAISLISILSRSIIVIVIIQTALFIFLASATWTSYKNKKKHQGLYFIYLLIFLFLIISIIDLIVPAVFQSFQLIIYLASSLIFMLILYKVLTKTPN